MERYSKPLESHILLVQEHSEFLVKRLNYYQRKFGDGLQKQLDGKTTQLLLEFNSEEKDLVRKMYSIREELRCIEKQVLKVYPQLEQLFKRLDILPTETFMDNDDGE